MIRVLLCAEGVTDQGREEYHDGAYIQNNGVFQVFIRKLTRSERLDFAVKSRSDIKRFALIPSPSRYTPKEQIKAKKIAAIATHENCSHIAYHRDEDNNGFEEMYAQVSSYFSVAKDIGYKCLAIIPMHMTESWLLCDAEAFPRLPDNPELPRRPEETWGAKNSDKHPKKYLERVLKQYHLQPSVETYCEIAEKSRAEVVKAKCPTSFGRFCNDMESFISICDERFT